MSKFLKKPASQVQTTQTREENLEAINRLLPIDSELELLAKALKNPILKNQAINYLKMVS